MKELTRQQAIEEHRKMWNWIGENAVRLLRSDSSIKSIKCLKRKYFKTKDLNIEFDCFCCAYTHQNNRYGDKCSICPIKWSGFTGTCYDIGGEYTDINKLVDYYTMPEVKKNVKKRTKIETKITKLAFKIAELPEWSKDV